jgi:hypothetical protein
MAFDRGAYEAAQAAAFKIAQRERKQIHHMRWDGISLQCEMERPAARPAEEAPRRSARGLVQGELL